MSYDLMVFRTETAPKSREDFMIWFSEQTKWREGHSYNDPANTSSELNNWFMDMIKSFPALNGPFASEEIDNDLVTDYCIGSDVIYVAFAWSMAEKAYDVMKYYAEKNKVGFYDVSANEGAILFTNEKGKLKPIDKLGSLSSIEQIKKWPSAKRNQSVMEIVYNSIKSQLNDK